MGSTPVEGKSEVEIRGYRVFEKKPLKKNHVHIAFLIKMRYDVTDLNEVKNIETRKCHAPLIKWSTHSICSPTAFTRLTTINDCRKYHTLVKVKTYSLDFRQKIRDVYHNEPLSQRAIANRFCVAISFVQS